MNARALLAHSAVYGLGQVLTRLASVLLLPFYTQHLTPADYGISAILDLTLQIFAILIGGGLVSASGRYHFDSDDPRQQNAVWWTSLTMVSGVATVLVASLLMVRQPLADVTFGVEVTNGATLWGIGLLTLWFTTIAQVGASYQIIRKWSTLSVTVSFGTLLLNIGLNVYLIAGRGLGVEGLLLGNLVTAAVSALVQTGVMVAFLGGIRFQRALAGQMLRFGAPLVGTALLSMMMHQADRVILRWYLTLDAVGIYSLAFTIGQGLNTLILLPFSSVWDVTIYDIAKRADAKRAFAMAFDYFFKALLLLLLGVSLFIGPLLRVLIPSEYSGVGPLVPVICLSFAFFSLHVHFRVPAILAKRTESLLLPCALAAAVNIAVNILAVPAFGLAGAAWANVVTYAVFSGAGLLQYRRIDQYEYPLVRCAVVLVAMIATYAACEAVQQLELPPLWALAVPAAAWSAWAALLLRPIVRHLFAPAAVAAVP